MKYLHANTTHTSNYCHIFSSDDESGTKVPSYDEEMPQHDYDEVAIDKSATLSPPAAVPPPDNDVSCV